MSLPQTYSRRKREHSLAGTAAVFRSAVFGDKLLQQIWLIFTKLRMAIMEMEYSVDLFTEVEDYLKGELGVAVIAPGTGVESRLNRWWISEVSSTDTVHDLHLDCIEIMAFQSISLATRKSHTTSGQAALQVARRLTEQLNSRMMEDSFGFQYEGGQIIEVTNEYLHRETIEPVLGVLADPAFSAAEKEFREALEAFKQGNYDDSIADCGNAFESTLKVIAARKRWPSKPTDRAAQLIETATKNGLFPAYMQSQLSAMKQLLTGVPTIRNNEGGHGGGEAPLQVEKHLASYQLHQTAAAIIFLVECSKR